jgi:hypothetical protein
MNVAGNERLGGGVSETAAALRESVITSLRVTMH